MRALMKSSDKLPTEQFVLPQFTTALPAPHDSSDIARC